MLDKAKAATFKKWIDKQGRIIIPDGPDADVTFIDVKEMKKLAMDDAPKGTRAPFSVLLRSDHTTALDCGRCHDLVLPDDSILEGVAIHEVTAHPNPNEAVDETMTHDTRVYEIVFA